LLKWNFRTNLGLCYNDCSSSSIAGLDISTVSAVRINQVQLHLLLVGQHC
jgi:hypothetical protein